MQSSELVSRYPELPFAAFYHRFRIRILRLMGQRRGSAMSAAERLSIIRFTQDLS
jgi:hypothetical protein